MQTILAIQHIECETPGTIAAALEAKRIAIQAVSVYKGEPVPKEMGAAAGLVIMGGPMGVYEEDRYPFLCDEIRLIEQAVKEDKAVLGVCLGSQLLAKALGARVTKGKKKEIGWYPVSLAEGATKDRLWTGVEPSFTAYHWHGDVFELPRGAELLASSASTPCQAFRYGGRAYGFLFHMEVTEKIIKQMVRTFAGELREGKLDGRRITEMAASYLPHLQSIGKAVFSRWAGLI
ncbi:MAG: type 1 glutamine amidotransferase [Deltaproteobacteria bacterium]|nr:type 1 glutamine amidotransferase [Deltaproteobacteria bacterium]